MNVLFVHQQSPRSPVMITCERCHTAWPWVADEHENPASALGVRLVEALAHPCSGAQSDHEQRVVGSQDEGPGVASPPGPGAG